MENDSRAADKLCIMMGHLVLEDFFLLSLYLFSCIAKYQMTLNSFDSCVG